MTHGIDDYKTAKEVIGYYQVCEHNACNKCGKDDIDFRDLSIVYIMQLGFCDECQNKMYKASEKDIKCWRTYLATETLEACHDCYKNIWGEREKEEFERRLSRNELPF
jgi:hypothetical protein